MKTGHVIDGPDITMPGHKVPVSSATFLSKFSGIEFAQFAEAIVGSGLGELRVACKLSDIGDPYFYICDGDESGPNRPYVFKPNGSDTLAAASGLTVTINRVNSGLIYGQVCEILITGDFTGLSLATLFARYNGVECAKIQPFSLGYKDNIGTPQERKISYNFLLPSPQSYILPDDCFISRNLVTQNAVTTWNGDESDWASLSAGLRIKAGKVYRIKLTPSEGATGQVRAVVGQFNGVWMPITTGGDPLDYIWSPDADTDVYTQTMSAGNRFIGEAELEICEIPNAIIFKNKPANIAEMFEQVVQQGDGHYVSAKNLAVNSPIVFDGTEADYTIKNTGFNLEEGEWYSLDAQRSADAVGQYQMNAFGYWGQFNERRTVELQSNLTSASYVQTNATPNGFIGAVKVDGRRLFKLSDYLQKQHQIEQINAAYDSYRAKNKSFYLVHTDGVDDHVLGPLISTPAGKFTIKGEFIAGSFGVDANLLELGYILLRNNKADEIRVWSDTNKAPAIFTIPTTVAGTRHSYEVTFEIGSSSVELVFDGQELGSMSAGGPVNFANSQQLKAGKWNSYHFDGESLCIAYIDHENPLPIAQGGNSGFWSLDGPTAIAEQKLGLDKKGRIVAKDGAGLGPELWIYGVHTFDGSGVQNEIAEGSSTALDLNQDLLVSFLWVNLTGRIRLLIGSDTSIISGNEVNNTDSITVLTNSGALARMQLQDVAGGSVADRVAISVKAHYGHGEWQGLSADLSEIQPVTRNTDGALVGPNLWLAPALNAPWLEVNGRFVIDGSQGGNATVTQAISVGSDTSLSYKLVVHNKSGAGDLFLAVSGALANISAVKAYDGVIVSGADAPNLSIVAEAGVSAEVEIQLVQTIIALSDELQRQHDLVIVEKQMNKQLKKAEKSMALCEFDGIDDYVSIPRITFTGGFKIPFFIQHDGVANRQILGDTENWLNRLSVDSATQIGARISSTTYAFTVPALGSLARWGYLVSDGGTLTLELDGVTYAPDGGSVTYSGNPTFNAIGQVANAQFYGGKLGAQPFIDYANPNNSRFYIHSKEGFKDVLHPDGSMDGTYQGMSIDLDEIQNFKKKGDDLYGDDISNDVVSLDQSVSAIVATSLEVGGEYLLKVAGLEGDSAKVYLNGWEDIQAVNRVTATQASLVLADFVRDQAGLVITVQKIIKGA